ncbi:MAG TPA: exodeoxyribonuclease VII large subunit, partial [Thermoanaerobaculia bacterium]
LPLRHGREALGRAEKGVQLAALRLAAAGDRIEEHARTLARLGRGALRQARRRQDEIRLRLAELTPRAPARLEERRRDLGARLTARAAGRLREVKATLAGLERLTVQLAPQRTLERGFSLTRGPQGRLLRDAAHAAPGDLLTTQLASGSVRSRVEEP